MKPIIHTANLWRQILPIVSVVCNFQITHKSEVVDRELDRAFVDKNIYLC